MSENDIMKISDTIIRIAHPQKLLLFGSGATGTMNSESDLVEDMEIMSMITARDPEGTRKGTISFDEYRATRVARRKKFRFKNNIKEAFDDVKAGRVKSVRMIK